MTKFSELATTSVLGDTDLIALTQGGQSRAMTGQSLKTAIPINLAGQKAAVSYFEPNPGGGEVTLVFKMPAAARLDSVDFDLAAGNLSLAVRKNGVDLSGLNAVAVTTAGQAPALGTGNDNDFATGDKLSVALSAVTAAEGLEASFNFTRL
ncbi:hypothetical protein [Denitrobaculum tricleocarpae]|uniref:Uncharacterized protein n=1 Tax=Denitrobaculum tricleocarpae TaxID=2591009 RepID=A0A545TUB0_9PROT|nr:hypothetical protein [Denitrobaculum tricleocarpae]TQV80804.1 hypothetical protein FKG95_11690 [Denitrobaculum tricleocarpae]